MKEIKLNIPITPNSNGFNDKFIIQGSESYPQHELMIMNRKGQKVYQSKNYNNDWDADNFEEGVYFYILRLGSGEEQFEENGTLSIYRNRKN